MRLLNPFLMCFIILIGCEDEDERHCPKVWEFDRQQISANAFIDSSELVLEVWNPESPNAILLSQSYIEGDFELSLMLHDMISEKLLNPQFRMEVVTISGSNEINSGIAVNPKAFYCYAGGSYPENGDMRIINRPNGTLQIARQADTIRCNAVIDGVSLEYSAEVFATKSRVQLIFGSTTSGSGKIHVRLDDFKIEGTEVESSIFIDEFDCRSW